MTSVEINSILDNSKELDRLKKEQEDVLGEINKIHKKLQTNPEIVEKSGDTVLTKLRSYYVLAKDLAEKELSVSNILIAQLDTLLQSAIPAGQRKKIDVTEPKKKRMKADSDVSKHSTAASVRSQLELAAGLKGEQVAARVTPDDAEKDEWFVVKVIFFDREAKEFQVLDEEPGDDEDGVGPRTYMLPMSRIIPFPKRTDPSSASDYPTGKHVLAVYPGTTALYKATVVNHRKRKSDDYLLEFDDDEEDGSMPQRTVPFHKVVPLPEGHRQ